MGMIEYFFAMGIVFFLISGALLLAGIADYKKQTDPKSRVYDAEMVRIFSIAFALSPLAGIAVPVAGVISILYGLYYFFKKVSGSYLRIIWESWHYERKTDD